MGSYLAQLRASSVLVVKRRLYLQVLDGWPRVRKHHLSVEAFHVERVVCVYRPRKMQPVLDLPSGSVETVAYFAQYPLNSCLYFTV